MSEVKTNSTVDSSEFGEAPQKHLVQISYRSGQVYKGLFSKFNIKVDGEARLTNVEATHADGDRFLFLGIRDIESIVQLADQDGL